MKITKTQLQRIIKEVIEEETSSLDESDAIPTYETALNYLHLAEKEVRTILKLLKNDNPDMGRRKAQYLTDLSKSAYLAASSATERLNKIKS